MKRLLRLNAIDRTVCGHRPLSIDLTRTGVLRMARADVRQHRGGIVRRCRLFGDPSVSAVKAVEANVHDLGKVGTSPGRGLVTVYCRRGDYKCVALTRNDGTTEWASSFVLRLRRDPKAVRRVARAMRRFLWFVKNDWRYTRPSSPALRREMRSSGRSRRNLGIGLSIIGLVATVAGSVMIGYGHSCPYEGLGCLGHLVTSAMGIVLLVPGIIITPVGLHLMFSGINKLSKARRLGLQSAFVVPSQHVLPQPARPDVDRRRLSLNLRSNALQPAFLMNLRFRF